MQIKSLLKTAVATVCLTVTASAASAEELTVATFVPPQHHTNTIMFKLFGEEL